MHPLSDRLNRSESRAYTLIIGAFSLGPTASQAGGLTVDGYFLKVCGVREAQKPGTFRTGRSDRELISQSGDFFLASPSMITDFRSLKVV